ncbi:MAG: NGG1p interacting factor NIF3 [Coriobacteriia bacterium]|nr:NGG1p interacting factor NIF3 [Coriobacteriia bacterium]MBN2822069.1 NGG1p interacting factor NIF3 [Coriobacteriia bacterium]
MKLGDIYKTAVDRGISNDGRSAEEIERQLATVKKSYDGMDEDEKEFFDLERLTNPYDDTRICVGDPDMDVRGLVAGIDMEVGEVLLADRMREKGTPVDLVLAHHPEGPGYANLHRVMYMQADLWAAQGVGIGLADALIAPRAEEIQRKIMPANHYRAIDAARVLGLSMMSCHTPADNCVNRFVQEAIAEADPRTLDDLVKMLRTIPEYNDAAKKGYGPILVQGKGGGRCGKMLVDMTGGTEGPAAALDRLSAAGVDTLVGMHYSEEHRKHAEEIGLNLVIAGHISSDTLGMNLVLDAIETQGVEVHCVSGMIRVRR